MGRIRHGPRRVTVAERTVSFAAGEQAELGGEGRIYVEVRYIGAVRAEEEAGVTEMGTAKTAVVAAKPVLD